MATPLKYMYNPAYFEELCPVLSDCIPNFNCRDFIFRIFNNRWPDLELKERVRHIAMVLHQYLPQDFPLAVKHIVAVAKTLEARDRSQRFENIFLPDYIEVYGLEYPEESLTALEGVTKLVSAEFAVRPFLLRNPDKVMSFFHRWSLSDHENVRRLASEGCRPRLPWGIGLPMFKKDPSPVLPILETLKEDTSLYVRKSVANNLNDISKDHPALIIGLARKWKDNHPHTNWIIRHGCRSLLKKGNQQALALQGFHPERRAVISELLLAAKKVSVGGQLDFSFSFSSKEKEPATFRLEYAIDYRTATGKISRKVFKISEKTFPPEKKVTIERKRSFRDFTTRKHFTGKHHLSILANGKKLAATEFIVS